MKKYMPAVLMALLVGATALAIDYMTGSTKAQRTLVANPTNLDLVTRSMVARQTPWYQVEDSGGAGTTYYYRWSSGTGSIYIERLAFAANTWTRSMTVATWANRTTATYVTAPQ